MNDAKSRGDSAGRVARRGWQAKSYLYPTKCGALERAIYRSDDRFGERHTRLYVPAEEAKLAMNYELITAEEYDALPEDDDQKFVAIEQICRRSMTQMIDENTRGEFDNLVRMQYMTTVAAARTRRTGKSAVSNTLTTRSTQLKEINNFLLRASGVVTRIRLRSGRQSQAYSVRLGRRTRARIEIEIQKLRGFVKDGELPESKRKALLAKLDEFMVELESENRLSFAKTMAILSSFSVAIAGVTAFLAETPDAIQTTYDAHRFRMRSRKSEKLSGLVPPLIALPPPDPPRVTRPQPAFDSDLDDDVPF